MARLNRWMLSVALAVALSATACSEDGSAPPGTAPPETAEPGVAATTAATPRPSPSAKAPEAGSMDPPAASSGALTKASFPAPEQLGAGWRYSVDPGSAEEGYAGNGTAALARRPAEIVMTAVPLGCARRAPMPAPRNALEVDYTLRGRKVIAVRGRFADRDAATAFFTGRERNLRNCVGRTGSQAIGPLVGDLTRLGPDALASDRTPESDAWREVSMRAGSDVVLVAAQGSQTLSDRAARRLLRAFRP